MKIDLQALQSAQSVLIRDSDKLAHAAVQVRKPAPTKPQDCRFWTIAPLGLKDSLPRLQSCESFNPACPACPDSSGIHRGES